MRKIWSGGVSDTGGPDLSSLMTEEDNEVDSYLVEYEIYGLIAYHLELTRRKVIPESETREILSSLLELLKGDTGTGIEYEDVHSMVEEKVKSVTEAGKDLRIFLSRNDQSHYDIRSFYMDKLLEIASILTNLSKKIKEHFSGIEGHMAGYTHYRQAMPVAFKTYFDYISAIFLDFAHDSLDLSKKLSEFLPLGYGSGYGSELPIDRNALASSLGFEESFTNPMHGAFYRGMDDLEVSFLATRIMVGISRFAQDLIILSSEEFRIINLPAGYTTGSSLMPNKRNPDFLEMIQGYASEAIATLMSSSTVVLNKGSGYHREFQLSKDKTIKYVSRLVKILNALEGLFAGIEVNSAEAAKVMENSTYSTMEVFRLFSDGMKWKDAYAQVGNKLRSNEPIKAVPPEPLTTVDADSIEEFGKTVNSEILRRSNLWISLSDRAKGLIKAQDDN